MTRGKFLLSLGALLTAPFLPRLAKGANKPLVSNVRNDEWYKPCFLCGNSDVWWCQWDDSGMCHCCGTRFYGGERMEATSFVHSSKLGVNYRMRTWTYHHGRFWSGDTIALI